MTTTDDDDRAPERRLLRGLWWCDERNRGARRALSASSAPRREEEDDRLLARWFVGRGRRGSRRRQRRLLCRRSSSAVVVVVAVVEPVVLVVVLVVVVELHGSGGQQLRSRWTAVFSLTPVAEVPETLLEDVVQQLLLLAVGRGAVVVQHEARVHGVVQTFLARGQVVDGLVNGFVRDHSVHEDGFRLAHAMRPVLSLPVHFRVEVDVVQDHGRRGGQVDAEAAGARTE
mmetsp:Transcript_4071/g.12669  ORF Transcript_4071/g.12669 Transcript_4071/m.12669 type:complete len:229 (-) Transcript_4071:552-1238(-)